MTDENIIATEPSEAEKAAAERQAKIDACPFDHRSPAQRFREEPDYEIIQQAAWVFANQVGDAIQALIEIIGRDERGVQGVRYTILCVLEHLHAAVPMATLANICQEFTYTTFDERQKAWWMLQNIVSGTHFKDHIEGEDDNEGDE